MASTNSSSPANTATIHSFPATKTRPFVAQLTNEKPRIKHRVLLRVKRLRTAAASDPLAIDASQRDGEQAPPKKRKVSSTTDAPSIIRLSLPPPKESEENELISRLSSAVSLYGDDATPKTPVRNTNNVVLPSSKTPFKPKRNAIFRKLTDVQKLLLHEKEEWDSKGEERSKWLRVVDVKLQEEEGSTDTTTAREEWTGRRVPRTRCHPEAEEGKNRKRRKVVVETSRTMSEYEFCKDSTEVGLDPDAGRLVDYALQTLCNQKGGTVAPFLSALRTDRRLGFVANTPRGGSMINRSTEHGRTVLHLAALWGDVAGLVDALTLGADPTVVDALGHTPSALAELNGHEDALLALLEAESRRMNRPREEDYYYEVYCLEDQVGDDAPFQVKVPDNRSGAASPNASSFTTSESEAMDSPPDLIRMDGHRMSEDEDSCALMELQNGFGYWDERGELVLEALGAKQPGSATSSLAYADDYCGSSGEDASIDYPDESEDEVRDRHGIDFEDLGDDYDDYFDADATRYNSSDDDSDAGWRLDFRNRLVPRCNIQDDDSDGESSAVGFGTNSRNRLHGWEYSGGMGDGDSDDEYAGPMLG